MKLLPTRKPVARTATSSHDSLGRGVEIAVSVGVFFVIGLMLDNAFETKPLLIIVCTLFSLLGSFARLWFVYGVDMQRQENKRRESATSHMRGAKVLVEK
ncbi:MAG: AtpZ/AtpI family protein [Acidimicrobiia bacterium]|nr:AtpZ/AtpI family protein [Acidimicrobiia bacterium]